MRRLFLGGPLDGEVYELDEDKKTYRHIEPKKDATEWLADSSKYVFPEQEERLYRLRGVHGYREIHRAMVHEGSDVEPVRLLLNNEGVEQVPYSSNEASSV